MNSNSAGVFSRTTNVAQRLFDERMLVITPKNSMLHRFNEAGTFIWQLLETPKTVGELCAAITAHFDGVDETRIVDDLVVFLEKLAEKKLVEVADEKGHDGTRNNRRDP